MKTIIDVQTDTANNRLNTLEIKRPKRKPLKLLYIYDAAGFIRALHIDGEASEMPTVPEIARMINQKFIDRIGLINLINTISTIETIETINVIEEITRIKDAPFFRENPLANPSFETGDLTGWTTKLGTPTVTNGAKSFSGFYVCKLVRVSGTSYDGIGQALTRPLYTNDIRKFSVVASAASGTPQVTLTLYYSNGTVSLHALTLNATIGTEYAITPTAAKWLNGISFTPDTDNSTIYIDEIVLSPSVHLAAGTNAIGKLAANSGVDIGDVDVLTLPNVAQATRTNLLTKPERDDLVGLYFTNTFAGAADYALLAAVAGQKHKLYGFDYETSAAVSVRIRSGTTTKAIGIRTTAGAMARTLPSPFVGNTNEALNFRAEAAVTVTGSILYITEA